MNDLEHVSVLATMLLGPGVDASDIQIRRAVTTAREILNITRELATRSELELLDPGYPVQCYDKPPRKK